MDPAREPLAAIARVLAETTSGPPCSKPIPENEVVEVTATAIAWRPADSSRAPLRELRFADIAGLDNRVGSAEYPGHSETIFVYLSGPEAAARAGAARPSLPIGRRFLEPRLRPPGSAAQLREALRALGYGPP